MTLQKTPIVGDKYVLPTGKQDASRLDLIHTVYAPISFKGLEAANISQAKNAADIGCGTGIVSRWMAQRMGKNGTVDAIDISPEQIEVAKSGAVQKDAAHINFKTGSAYDPQLPESSFDIVFCRLVLCHLKEPAKAVAQMAKLLKSGGRLVLVDMDLRTMFTMPASQHHEEWIKDVVIPHKKNIGVDYSIGLKLHELMQDAGLETTFIASDQPLYKTGPEKLLWETTSRSSLPFAVSAGSIAQERGEELLAGRAKHVARPDVWVAATQMFAAVGAKAG